MSLKQLVNNKPIWDAFNKELDELIALEHRSLESITEPTFLHRAQGKILALRQLKLMRDKVNGPRRSD
jgi:hypothetical protein